MQKFFLLEPEIAGGRGPSTEFTSLEDGRPLVTVLEYRFDDWLGDDIVESYPCFAVTKKLADELLKTSLSGFDIKEVTISVSDTFKQIYPNGRELPKFKWLNIIGKAAVSKDNKNVQSTTGRDFCQTENRMLLVNQHAMYFLKSFNISNCLITEI